MSQRKQIYKSIINVTDALAKSGIAKDQYNQQQRFAYRGIDSVYSHIAPLLVENNIVISINTRHIEITERQTKAGSIMYHALVSVDYTLVHAEDDSRAEYLIFGEAADMGALAINKAMSAAYKTLCFQAFCVPVEASDAESVQIESITTITPEQLDELADYAVTTGADKVRWINYILKYYGDAGGGVPAMPVAHIEQVKAGLKVAAEKRSTVAEMPDK